MNFIGRKTELAKLNAEYERDGGVPKYFSIIKAIADENHKLGKIAGALGQETSALTPYLSTLANLGFIEKKTPITEKNPEKSRKGLYFISDNFIRFWFRYVYPYKGEMELDNMQIVLDEVMNEAMIAAWNERVHGNDTVYIVGDMFFRCADPESILKRLKGKKRLLWATMTVLYDSRPYSIYYLNMFDTMSGFGYNTFGNNNGFCATL